MAMEMFVFQFLSNPGDWTSMLFFGARQSQASKQANRPWIAPIRISAP